MRLWILLFAILLLLSPASFGYGVHDSMMSPEGLERLFETFKNYSDWTREKEKAHRADFEKFMPRAQQILLIRDHLVPLLEAYKETNPQDFYASKMLEIVQKTFPENAHLGDPNNIQIFFDYSPDGRFQVDGIEAERLAINNSLEIRFNILGLLKKENLTISDTVQLWLHELSHFDTETPLETRDKWVAKLTQWTQEHTNEFNLEGQRRIITLILPAPIKLPEAIQQSGHKDFWAVTPESIHIAEVKKGFLILEQDSKGTRFYSDAYNGFQTFDNFIKNGASQWDGFAFQTLTVNWPTVQVRSVKLLPNKNIQFDFTQRSNIYKRDIWDQRKFIPGSVYSENPNSIMPDFPENNYRVEIDPNTSTIDIKRNYSQTLQDGDFEIYRVQDNKNERYVSIHLKLKDVLNNLNQSTSLHLIGKDNRNAEVLSFELGKMRILNKDEVLFHVKVPNRSLEISQIILPRTDRNGRYSEVKILPSKPFSLMASKDIKRNSSNIDGLEITDKQFPEDSVHAQIRVDNKNKKIVGVTVDLEHTLLGIQQSSPQQFAHPDELTYIGEGRKYFIKAKDLKFQNSILSFAIPEDTISQIKQGPMMERHISRFYTERFRPNIQTLRDTQVRGVRALWVHFSDGTLAKLPEEKLPKERFNLRFDGSKVQIRECKDLFNSFESDTGYADTFG